MTDPLLTQLYHGKSSYGTLQIEGVITHLLFKDWSFNERGDRSVATAMGLDKALDVEIDNLLSQFTATMLMTAEVFNVLKAMLRHDPTDELTVPQSDISAFVGGTDQANTERASRVELAVYMRTPAGDSSGKMTLIKLGYGTVTSFTVRARDGDYITADVEIFSVAPAVSTIHDK